MVPPSTGFGVEWPEVGPRPGEDLTDRGVKAILVKVNRLGSPAYRR